VRDYELKSPPPTFKANLIFIWILILANKYKVLGAFILLISVILIIRKYNAARS